MGEELRNISKQKNHAQAVVESATIGRRLTQGDDSDEENEQPLHGEQELIQKYADCCKECREHIHQYVCQKDLLREYVKIAKEDKVNNVPLGERTIVLTEDMMQKATVPWLASEQVDVTYYFSPKTQHVFGWADDIDETINCYIWAEGVEGSGANEICSYPSIMS